MPQIPLKWPFGGLSETHAFGEQEQGTAREYQNVRGLDPRTGRLRGAQRSGLSKYMTSFLSGAGSTKVADLVAFFIDNRGVTYSAIASGSETVTWDVQTPSKTSCPNIKTDRQGNVYAIDGNAGIVKFSADEAQQWQLALPVSDTNHVCRALFVDDFDVVYAGVSEGGEEAKAKLFCYEQLPDNKTEKLWEIETKAYIEDVRVANSKLYTIQNEPSRKRSYVRVYEFFDTANPELTKEWRVPHPVNSITVKKGGEVVVACEPAGDTTGLYWRDPDPKFTESFPDSVDWTPRQLSNADRRIWSWYTGDDIDQSDLVSDLAEGVEVSRWRDTSKNYRHFFAPYDDAQEDTGPLLALDSYVGHKGLRFTQPNNLSNAQNPPFQALRTNPNSSTSKTFADQQRTMLPAYGSAATPESAFAIYIVCRPAKTDQTAASTRPRWVFGQDRDNAASGSDDHILFINANDNSANTLPPTTDAGAVYWYMGQSQAAGGGGTTSTVNSGVFDARNDTGTNPDGSTTNLGELTIIHMVCDGGVTNADTIKSLFGINGSPIDKFTSIPQFTLRPTYVGIWRATQGSDTNPATGAEGYMGDILEIVVLDRNDRNESNPSKLVVTADNLEATDAGTSQSVNEHTCMVGYLAHKYGAQANLPFGTAAVGNYPHPFGITGTSPDQLSGPPNQAGTGVNDAQALANKRFGCVVKYSAEGKIQWCANEMELIGGLRSGGYGYAVAVNSDGNIYSLGPEPTGPGSDDNATIRLIIDQGTDFSIQVADGAWSDSAAGVGYKYPKIDVDEFDNVYFPKSIGFRVFTKTGSSLHSFTLSDVSTFVQALAVDRKIPDYRNDLATKTVEHVFIATTVSSVDNPSIFKMRLVAATQSGATPRTLTTMGVAGGNIAKFTTSGVTAVTGGTGALDSTAKYVQSTSLYKKVYWTDGRQYQQYDPVTDAVTPYASTSAGKIPDRCQLIDAWRGRIVLARSADEPHNWFLSKKDEPLNFDFFPPVPGETDAVAGNNSPAGLCPDIINALVPYSEDILVFGCDHSIWMLVGDPASGGRLELVSDITGMAFGRPWTKDPNGVLYFFGSQGGVYRWVPGARPERISALKIDRQLQEVDLSTHYMRLVYNYKDEGIHILQCPFGAGGTHVSHWFLELKTSAFALDVFGTETHTNIQPTAVVAIDGDDFDDRLVLIGGEDGRVRKWDRAARSDDARLDGNTKIPIISRVTLGPLGGSSEEQIGMEMQFSGLTVVLGDQDQGARWELYASDEPESIGIVRRAGSLNAGRNPPKWDRVVGPYCWLTLQNSSVEERWSFERAYLTAEMAGMARPRTIT